jgi:hypothetical protein
VCFSFAWRQDGKVKTLLLNYTDGVRELCDLLEQAARGEIVIAGHNLPYDVAVSADLPPSLYMKPAGPANRTVLELFFDAYEAGNVHCTQAGEWLNDNAMGLLRSEWNEEKDEYTYKKQYSLENLARIHLDQAPYKDEWRMRYGELREIPIKQWPARAQEYPKQDAEFTLRIAECQRELAEKIEPHNPLVAGLAHTCRSYLALHLASVWGEEIDPERVAQLNDCLDAYALEILERETFTDEDENEIEIESLEAAGLIHRTMRGKNAGKLTEKKLRLQEMVANDLLARGVIEEIGDLKSDSSEWLPEELLTKGGKSGKRTLSVGSSVLADCVDPVLKNMSLYKGAKKLQSNFGKPLVQFGYGPLHSRYNYAETGRTTCSGGSKKNRTGLNVQQLVSELPDELLDLMIARIGDVVDVRSCFVPRKGYVQSSTDFKALEMCTFAEVLMNTVGWSSLREAINNKVDPHIHLAAEQWLKMSYDDAYKLIEVDGDPMGKDLRKLAKVPNFGLPGGMGGKTLVKYAKGFYGSGFVRKHFGATQSEQWKKGYQIKDQWFETWPETPEYMKIMGDLVGDGDATIIQLYSNRIHGGCTFTMACNTMFQGLAADLATDGLWRIVRECYDARLKSALYGSRVTAFIHDEYRAEHPEECAHEAATRLGEIAVETGHDWCPSVAFEAEPTLMRRWYKAAKTVRDEHGRLVPWEPKARKAA